MTHTQDLLELDAAQLERVGKEAEQIVASEAFQLALTLLRAEIFTAWVQARSARKRARLHSEITALELIVDKLKQIDQDGFVAGEARRQRAESGTDLSPEA